MGVGHPDRTGNGTAQDARCKLKTCLVASVQDITGEQHDCTPQERCTTTGGQKRAEIDIQDAIGSLLNTLST